MQKVEVRISRLNDKEPLFPEVAKAGFEEGDLESLGILEGGTTDGNASLSMNIRLKNGKYIVAQVTGAMYETIAGALKGAVERWEIEKRDGPKN